MKKAQKMLIAIGLAPNKPTWSNMDVAQFYGSKLPPNVAKQDPRTANSAFLLSSAVMDAAPIFSSLHVFSSINNNYPSPSGLILANRPTHYRLSLRPSTAKIQAIPLKRNIGLTSRSSAVINDNFYAIGSDPAQAEITWQIVIGALAGVTPFVVAGIEFSKRIAEQRNCKVCKGSGLVLRDNKYYFRCPGCT